jgi:hypothetical protein
MPAKSGKKPEKPPIDLNKDAWFYLPVAAYSRAKRESISTTYRRAHNGTGPPIRKIGRNSMILREDHDAWVARLKAGDFAGEAIVPESPKKRAGE